MSVKHSLKFTGDRRQTIVTIVEVTASDESVSLDDVTDVTEHVKHLRGHPLRTSVPKGRG